MARHITPKQAELDKAKDELRAILDRNHMVYAVVHHVSRSGVQRQIDFYVIDLDPWDGPSMRRISHLIAKVRGSRLTDDGVVINGTGMDMGWHEIYSVRYMLGLGEFRFPQGPHAAKSLQHSEFVLGYGFDVRYP